MRFKSLNKVGGISNIDFIEGETFENVNDKHKNRFWDK